MSDAVRAGGCQDGHTGGELAARLAVQVVVIAKEPLPGRTKTRLCPPYSPDQAAALAEAALTDTLDAVTHAPVQRWILALTGSPGRWVPAGFDVTGQRGQNLDERLAAAFEDAYGRCRLPVVLVGMDSPQLTPGLLQQAAASIDVGAADAVFGPAADGGFWLLGLREPDGALLRGVPMSSSATGPAQLLRLTRAGLRTRLLPTLTDVDTAADARSVAAAAPGSRFAAALAALDVAGHGEEEPV